MNGDEEEGSSLPGTSLLWNGVRASFTAYLYSASHRRALAWGWDSQQCWNLKKKPTGFVYYFIEPSLTIRDVPNIAPAEIQIREMSSVSPFTDSCNWKPLGSCSLTSRTNNIYYSFPHQWHLPITSDLKLSNNIFPINDWPQHIRVG